MLVLDHDRDVLDMAVDALGDGVDRLGDDLRKALRGDPPVGGPATAPPVRCPGRHRTR